MPCDQKISQSFDVFAIANGAGPAPQSVEVMVGLAEPWCFDAVLCVRRLDQPDQREERMDVVIERSRVGWAHDRSRARLCRKPSLDFRSPRARLHLLPV